jgi:cell division protein FtsI/penicillin-binding protein 2
MSIISQQMLEDRMAAIAEETMVKKAEPGTAIIEENILEKMEMPLKTKRGEDLYQRFCMIRNKTRTDGYEEDLKVRDLFLKIAKEQAEAGEAELYNKESEGELLENVGKSGLQEAFEEMLAAKKGYEQLEKETATKEN